MSKEFRLLLFSRGLSAGLGLLTSLYLARTLGVAKWGNVSLVIAVLTFVSMASELSLFSSMAKVLVKADKQNLANMKGVSLILLLFVSVLSVVLSYVLAHLAGHLFNHEVHSLLSIMFAYSWVFVLPIYIEQMYKSLGEIRLLSAWTLSVKLLLPGFVLALLLKNDAEELTILYCYFGSIAVPSILLIAVNKVKFNNLKNCLAIFRHEHQGLGKKIFLGKQLNLLSYNTDKIILGATCSAEMVGFYSLAMTMSSGISMFASTLAVTQFKAFGNSGSVNDKIFTTYLTWMLGILLASVIVSSLVVVLYLGDQFVYVLWVLLPASIALLMQGLYQPYNSWLLANGKGAQLRSFLLKNAVVNIISNVIMIPLLCGLGAALASIAGNGFYYRSAKRACQQEMRSQS